MEKALYLAAYEASKNHRVPAGRHARHQNIYTHVA